MFRLWLSLCSWHVLCTSVYRWRICYFILVLCCVCVLGVHLMCFLGAMAISVLSMVFDLDACRLFRSVFRAFHSFILCLCVCMRAFMRACVRACVCMCVHVCCFCTFCEDVLVVIFNSICVVVYITAGGVVRNQHSVGPGSASTGLPCQANEDSI